MRRKGFTLLALVLVVAIVMILVSIVVAGYGRNLGRLRLRFVGMTVVADLRQIRAEVITEGAYQTIVFVTDENRYYFREGTKSWAPVGVVRVERRLSSSAGFPLAVGKRNPVSAVFGPQTSMVSPVVTMSFNEAGRPAGAAGGGHVTLMDVFDDRVDVIVTPVDGIVHMQWFQ